jgi:hypothetical protein
MSYKFGSAFVILVLLLLFGCEKSVENSDVDAGTTGILSIKLMDSPFPIDLVSEANVKISKVEVRQDNNEPDGDPFLILSEKDTVFNLLELQNGISADLVKMEVPVGDYSLVRLYVDSAGITLKDETEFDLKVPSGEQTGIKIVIEPPVRVVGGLTSELMLDFDVSKSFVVQGNPSTQAGIKGFIFKPVIHAVNTASSGSIQGKVLDNESNTLEDASVWIEADTTTYTTFTDTDGFYLLSGIPQGTYTVNATKQTADAAYDTVSVENVEVITGNVIQLDDFILTQK